MGARKEEILKVIQEFEPRENLVLAFGDDRAADRMTMLVVGGWAAGWRSVTEP